MRKTVFANNEYYHIYNRGNDGRGVFLNQYDMDRFFQGMTEFNTTTPIGSIYEHTLKRNKFGDSISKSEELVEFIAYCLNPNHYHFIIKQVSDNGIVKFMHKLGLGYSMYFNEKHKKSGSLFQGRYKAIHINSNEYLLHLSAYVNLNNEVHRFGDSISKSSWSEYTNLNSGNLCKKEIILGQFNNCEQYERFAKSSLEDIIKRKDMVKLIIE